MTAPGSTILAVELGEFNSVLCWYDSVTRGVDFRTAETTPEVLRRELTRRPVFRVTVEACAQAGWVHDLCADLDVGAIVASSTGAMWQWKRVKRKTVGGARRGEGVDVGGPGRDRSVGSAADRVRPNSGIARAMILRPIPRTRIDPAGKEELSVDPRRSLFYNSTDGCR
jgi:hypothetical protein